MDRRTVLLALVTTLAGCGGDPMGMPMPDAGAMVPADDGGVPFEEPDAYVPEVDAGPPVPTYALTLRTTEGWGHGTLAVEGMGEPCEGECVVQVPQGGEITVVATPGAGQAVGELTGACASIAEDDRCTFTMSADATVGVYFTGGRPLGLATFGGSGLQRVSEIEIAPDGDIVAAGEFFGSLTPPGGGAPTAAYGTDTFVARLSPDGTELRWLVRTRGAGNEYPNALAIDENGRAFVVGAHSGQLMLGATTLDAAAPTDTWIARIDADGTIAWVRTLGSGSQAYAVLASRGDGVYAAGRAGGSSALFSIDPDDGTPSVVTLSGTGHAAFVIAYAPEGDFYVGGPLDGMFGPITRGSAMYLARVSPSGGIAWARSWGGTMSSEWLSSLASAPDGRVFATWGFDGTVTAPARETTSTSIGWDWGISSFDALGAPRWSRTGGGALADAASDVALGPDGALYVVGRIEGEGTNPVDTQTSLGGDDGWLVRIEDGAAGAEFRIAIAASDDVQLDAIAVSDERLVVSGFWWGTGPLGQRDASFTADTQDGFVMSFGR